jgi:hypothetical protein
MLSFPTVTRMQQRSKEFHRDLDSGNAESLEKSLITLELPIGYDQSALGILGNIVFQPECHYGLLEVCSHVLIYSHVTKLFRDINLVEI